MKQQVVHAYEKSSGYAHFPYVATIFAKHLSGSKILYVMREPVQRLFSYMLHHRSVYMNGYNEMSVEYLYDTIRDRDAHIWARDLFLVPSIAGNGGGNQLSSDSKLLFSRKYEMVKQQLLFFNAWIMELLLAHKNIWPLDSGDEHRDSQKHRELYYNNHADMALRGVDGCYYYPLLAWLKAYGHIQLDHRHRVISTHNDDSQVIKVMQSEWLFSDVGRAIRYVECWVADADKWFVKNQLQYETPDTFNKLSLVVKKDLFDFYSPCRMHLQEVLDVFPQIVLGHFDFGLWELN
ncbi:hypothetical protein RFI_07210 [Reticulomyxa filosa]|uniref:Uncharacterized protein n=1 Tax=Reticulomyxa filosa TaxID=46433 RepID=X6NUE1_RETFI|nr:hypothetical protein RFI_07210 [Reticulomyxa filosa]|eukprot:ETO29910.1 hypothetical protein RFI_07210 [Reticulomyxa filosa]